MTRIDLDELYSNDDPLIDVTYGLFPGGDPRDFLPDAEDCTPEEIAAWEAACAEWDRGEGTDRGPGCATMGDSSAWTGTGFGIGTKVWHLTPEEAERMRE